MYNKNKLFESVEKDNKNAIIENIKKEYLSGKTIKEISENYSFSERQVRYIINYYLKMNNSCRNKGGKIMKEKDNKIKKATLEDLIKKAKIVKEQKDSTNKKVENNN